VGDSADHGIRAGQIVWAYEGGRTRPQTPTSVADKAIDDVEALGILEITVPATVIGAEALGTPADVRDIIRENKIQAVDVLCGPRRLSVNQILDIILTQGLVVAGRIVGDTASIAEEAVRPRDGVSGNKPIACTPTIVLQEISDEVH